MRDPGNEVALSNSQKREGGTVNVIDASKKRICRLRLEFKSPHVIERRRKNNVSNALKKMDF